MKHVVVIGAGIGGLAAAARLARSGVEVTVLEAHVYAGGCAGTFYHQGYRFDAGATLAGGFYPGGPMDLLGRSVGIENWPVQPANPALVVHLPGGAEIARWTDEQRWAEYRAAFGSQALEFWRWQENTADLLWDLALELPPWPPQTAGEVACLVQAGSKSLKRAGSRRGWSLLADARRKVADHLTGMPESLCQFVDGQLLISAQATSPQANALYGAAALDLPRRGVVHVQGGMGAIAAQLVQAVRRNGGHVRFRQEVVRIGAEKGKLLAVQTRRGETLRADQVIANLTPWNIARLLGDSAPAHLRGLSPQPEEGWGAFVVYGGIEDRVLPGHLPLHHQVIRGEPLGEGNSIFLSLSPAWDANRAPAGQRVATLSTHTALKPWWDLSSTSMPAYEARKADYTRRLLEAAEVAVPGIGSAARLILSGTPLTFERFTRRAAGWVGGYPQTGLAQQWGPRLAEGLWMVGDSIFPGQSTAATALGGLRVANAVLGELGARQPARVPVWVKPGRK